MNQEKQIWKNYLIRITFIFAMLGFCFLNKGIYVQAEDVTVESDTVEPSAVEVLVIDYENGTLDVKANGNTKVYYSDSSQKTWNLIEGKMVNDHITMDISWITISKDYELNLKGNKEETVVSVDLPKYNSSLKVKFDKIDGTLEFTNEGDATEFEWRKSAAIDTWSTAPIDLNADGAKEFSDELEELRAKGGKIQVRIPQKTGGDNEKTGFDAGSRPSKVVTVSITKRANAPSVKVVSNSMQVNTTNKMEYKLIFVGGQLQDTEWAVCDQKMSLTAMAPQVLTVSGASVGGQDVIVAVRKAETDKIAYTKTKYLEIPAQPAAPDSSTFGTSKTSSKFGLIIGNASKTTPYQYAVVAKGDTKSESELSWKTVTSSKEISFSSKKYPEGSTIYVRTGGVNLTKKVALKLPSAATTVQISYLTETAE